MTIAVYAGSFDPFTLGHLYITNYAASIFGHVVVLIADNPGKQYFLSQEERIAVAQKSTQGVVNCSVAHTDGLVGQYAQKIGAQVLVRGIRSKSDFEVEMNLANINRALRPEIRTVLLPTDPSLSEMSSSLIRQMIKDGQDVRNILPPGVVALLKDKING